MRLELPTQRERLFRSKLQRVREGKQRKIQVTQTSRPQMLASEVHKLQAGLETYNAGYGRRKDSSNRKKTAAEGRH